MNNIFTMQDRRVLITGGATGLGKGFADTYLQEGAFVMLAARREEKLKQTTDELNAKYGEGRASYVCMDVSSEESIKSAMQAVDDWGLVDVLVNNAGVVNEQVLLDLDSEGWDFVSDINLKGVWLLSKEVVSRFTEKQADKNADMAIINIASVLGLGSIPGSGVYGASKAALIHLTNAMAVEWARFNIRVNAIAPGYINTDMAADYIESPFGQKLLKCIPHRRFGEVEDVCGLALLLASPASKYMTGTVIPVDGGHSITKLI